MLSRWFVTRMGPTVLAVALLARAAIARADGAFPDSLAILLPADRPDTIVLATNFGVLTSSDAGASWRYVCERAIGPYAAPYQLGPAPDDRLFAVTYDGLSVSTDLSCSWAFADADFTSPTDVFPDPSDPSRVFVIASAVLDDGSAASAAFESDDGGASFGAPIWAAPAGAYLTGVEVARSDPATVFLSMYGSPAGHAALVVTHDGGENWQTVDLAPSLGMATARIAAVDPEDASRLYLRVQDGTPHDRLAVADDEGATVTVPLVLETPMTAFLRRPDGTILVGSAEEGGAFVSDDGGVDFRAWANAPHLRALGERDGILYAVGDNFVDGFAVARSEDDGATWQPLLRYDEIAGPSECGDIPVTCEFDWADLKQLFGIDDQPEPEPPPDGCDCATTANRGANGAGLAVLFALAGLLRSRPRRS